MNLQEIDRLLTVIQNVDKRRIDDATVLVWHEILGDLPFDDCLLAVTTHFRESTEYLMPAHIVRMAREVDRERRRQLREEQEAIAAQAEADDPTRRDRSAAVRELIAQLRTELPEGDPDSLRHSTREWRRAREGRERALRAVPNPHYDPTALARLADEPGRAS